MNAGPRQTCDRAKHATLGEGLAVYDHGPAFFLPDGGEAVPMRSIGFGGAGSAGCSRGRYSVLRATELGGASIELDTLDRASGDRHYRRWHPAHGAGWLVAIGGASWHRGGPTERWEGDNGTVIAMRVQCMKVGKPGDWSKSGNERKGRPAEHDNWFTYELDTGETFVFRRASHEELPIAKGDLPAPKRVAYVPQLVSAPVPRAPTTNGWPGPDATKAEVDAFMASRGARA